jgi:CubicO group peptidase (beta-lactamase class C family)
MPSPSRDPLLHAALAPYVERGDNPGFVAAIARDGREALEVLGVKSAGGSEPLEPDSIFRISSLTKPVTATAAMLLVEEGRLHLDEPIDRLLPELAGRRVLRRVEGPVDDVVPAVRAVTVRDLLTFRLGFGMLMAPPGTYPIQRALDALALGEGMPRPAEPPELDAWIRRFATLPLMHQPGERWLYNTSANVLGALIARAAEQPFDAFLRERVFTPLGMHDTDFSVPASKLGRFTPSYVGDPQTQKPSLYDPVDGQWSKPPAFPGGAAGLVSTVPDFLRFAALLLARGVVNGRRFLSEESARALTTDALTPENKAFGALVPGFFESYGWGFGMAVVTAERDELGRAAGSYGWDGGLGSTWYNDPGTRTTGVLFTQRSWSNPAPPPEVRDFWRVVTRAP